MTTFLAFIQLKMASAYCLCVIRKLQWCKDINLYCRVVKTIFYEWAQWVSKIVSSPLENNIQPSHQPVTSIYWCRLVIWPSEFFSFLDYFMSIMSLFFKFECWVLFFQFPEMRIGFSHGSNEEHEFHLALDPLVSIETLNPPLTNQLQRSMQLFTIISNRMNTIKMDGSGIERDLSVLVSHFKDGAKTTTEIQGAHENMDFINIEQVKQALIIVKDIIQLTSSQGNAIMDYIVQQGSNVDLHVVKDNPDKPKVIIFAKKYGNSKQRRGWPLAHRNSRWHTPISPWQSSHI